ncbi:RNA-binding protein [Arenimonas sp.]|nr:RNA-binding protein [Candidatus Parcubacteria bacterium]
MDAVNNKKLYVGNLSWGITDDSLKAAFAEFGEVTSAQVAMDRMTGRSRGFAFVEFAADEAAAAAVAGLDGHELDGRELRVNIAMPKTEGGSSAPRRSFGGGDRGGQGGGYSRGGDSRGGDRGGYSPRGGQGGGYSRGY